MSHPVLWPKKIFFYPIGNTPPVCLTQALGPEDPAKILLLGCGDPRSILYTRHAGLKLPGKPRPLDFTCCDFEPAVLARNALLFTLILDGYLADEIWPIFFHFKISSKSMALLVSQCEKLIAIDFEASSSPYSGWLRLCSRDTLSRIRRHWQLYAEAKDLTQGRNSQLLNAFAREYKTHKMDEASMNYTASRSAGPFWTKAMTVVGKHFRYYWETGIVSRNKSDVASATIINPTFIYSVTGEGCAVHYGTYPLQCFHLAEAYATSTATTWEKITEKDLVTISMVQFGDWCQSFKEGVLDGSVTVRLFAGDALAFCKTLHHFRETSLLSASLYLSAWSGTELVLDGGDYASQTTSPAPTIFNVIDTSNIMDHVGLLNLLVVTIPLLQHSPTATLYTEALLVVGKDGGSGLQKRLCMDIPTAVTLFGIAPVGCISNFSSTSNVGETMLRQMLKSEQHQEKINWKVPYLGDPAALDTYLDGNLQPSFEPSELAKTLFGIYHNMFPDEDMSILQNKLLVRGRHGYNDAVHYHRGSFAALLGMVKSRVRTDWAMAMKALFDMLRSDRKLIMGTNSYQDLSCQLNLRGIFSVETLGPDAAMAARADYSKGIFKNWTRVPKTVCLVVVVPRSSIKILEDMESNRIGSPMFECRVRGSTFNSVFSSIQIMFGNASVRGSGQDASASIEEDATGLCGGSPLIFSVWIPAFILAIEPSNMSICLALRATGMATLLAPKLGMELNLFSANLTEKKCVFVVSTRPHRATELDVLATSSPHSPLPHTTSQKVSVICESAAIRGMSNRWDLGDFTETLSGAEVKQYQISPCAITVSVDQMKRNLFYPFPVNGNKAKLSIARKSGWIEVTAPILWPYSPDRFFAQTCAPLVLRDHCPQLWNIHRLSLESLPIFDIRRPFKSDWVSLHVSSAFSDREAKLRSRADNTDILSLVKDTIHALFLRSIEPNALRIYGLSDPSNGGVYTIFFMNELRIDPAAYTLVADVCILPLTKPFIRRYGQQIADLTDEKMMTIITEGTEVSAWKHILPALAERCRTWSHKESCEYVKKGESPLSVAIYENSLCSCGEGFNLGALSQIREWKELSQFMTRAAFSPLFAISYLESTDGLLKNIPTYNREMTSATGAEAIGRSGTRCASCGNAASGAVRLLNCGRCKQVSYCGRNCQTTHWKTHKQTCRAV